MRLRSGSKRVQAAQLRSVKGPKPRSRPEGARARAQERPLGKRLTDLRREHFQDLFETRRQSPSPAPPSGTVIIKPLQKLDRDNGETNGGGPSEQ